MEDKKLKKKTTEDFKKEVFDLVSNEYEVLEEYKGSGINIKMLHKKCNKIFSPSPRNFLRKGKYKGTRCFYCFGDRLKTTEEFKEEVFNIVGDEYKVIGSYGKSTFDKISMRHNICGKEYLISPHDFKSTNCRCPFCSKNNPKSTERFKLEVKNLVGNEYTVLGEYKRTNSKILIKHEICGEEYEVKPSHFISDGTRCPRCFNYKNEKEILTILDDLNLKFIKNKIFDNLSFKRSLRFDFYLPNLNSIIEYDGEQHFIPIYGKEELKLTKKRDRLKDEFCQKNNINLLRIPYTQKENKKEIIHNFLKL
jgi:mRNA-degrading endonuclease HigB of HigAB toxin-antitoxin module/very-short-patch-repair endonuclease